MAVRDIVDGVVSKERNVYPGKIEVIFDPNDCVYRVIKYTDITKTTDDTSIICKYAIIAEAIEHWVIDHLMSLNSLLKVNHG